MSAGWDPSVPQPSNADYAAGAVQYARSRTALPGLLLIVVGIFSLLGALAVLNVGVHLYRMTDDQYQTWIEQTIDQTEQMFPGSEAAETLRRPEFRGQATQLYLITAALWGVVAVVIFLAGFRMRQVRGYGLASMGSFLAMLPCVHCGGCLGLGQIAGIWALVVLFDPMVRMAFTVMAMPPGQQYPGQYPNPNDPRPGG